jgi:tRNA splicing ligase
VFSKEGKVIARRYHKFFNINEIDETKVENIDTSQPFVILEKLDGSMVSPYISEGKLRFATKKVIRSFADVYKTRD